LNKHANFDFCITDLLERYFQICNYNKEGLNLNIKILSIAIKPFFLSEETVSTAECKGKFSTFGYYNRFRVFRVFQSKAKRNNNLSRRIATQRRLCITAFWMSRKTRKNADNADNDEMMKSKCIDIRFLLDANC